jgi:hypothetical protein
LISIANSSMDLIRVFAVSSVRFILVSFRFHLTRGMRGAGAQRQK